MHYVLHINYNKISQFDYARLAIPIIIKCNIWVRCCIIAPWLKYPPNPAISHFHLSPRLLYITLPTRCHTLVSPACSKVVLSARSFIPCFHTSCRVSSFEFGLGTHDFQQNGSTKVVWHTALQKKSCKNNPFSCRKHNNTFYYCWITCFCTYLRTYLFLYEKIIITR